MPTEAYRTQLRDEYRERIKSLCRRHQGSRGVPQEGIVAYAARLDAEELRKLVYILNGQFEQLCDDILRAE